MMNNCCNIRFKALMAVAMCLSLFCGSVKLQAADPTATAYGYEECRGSAMPYVVPSRAVSYPDSLTPVFINHVGRHGARFLSSPRKLNRLVAALRKADSLKTITPLGRRLLSLTGDITRRSEGQWGALDSLGMAEQRGIASRMYALFPELFRHKKIEAISSYVPRCIMSMDVFTHQLSRLDNKLSIYTSSGRQNNSLLRFFEDNTEYREAVRSTPVKDAYEAFENHAMTLEPLRRVLGAGFPYDDSAADLAMDEYSVLAGTAAMGMSGKECDLSQYFRPEEINALWSINNLSQYLQRTATTLTPLPAEIAAPLLRELVNTTDDAVNGKSAATVMLRFGHAETLMPLFALMRLPGCWYLTNYFDTVALNWHNFYVVPMASNLQMILFRSDSGRHYVRFDLNEVPVKLRHNVSEYLDWNEARQILIEECLPLWEQP
ncbi:MAG: hypothetical protein K2M29_03040 [Paramuribaculum sp.]|nr:hypothetical protein [Paramuribaculum sp.]